MLLKILLFAVLVLNLHAKELLKKNYFVDGDFVKLSSIVKNPQKDTTLFKIDQYRYFTKIQSKELLKILKEHGYNSFYAKVRYIKFTKKSPINLDKIKNEIIKLYKTKYSTITINKLTVRPRGYIESLPKSYKISFRSRSYLSNTGTLSIKTPQKRKIFFDYCLDAKINLFIAKKSIKKGTKLSILNTLKKSVVLDRFRAIPLQQIPFTGVQSKHHIKQNSIITSRDIEPVSLVKRDSMVNVFLNSNGVSISFSAKALQDGKLNDIITIQKHDYKRLKVRVVGKNRVEIK